MSPARTAELQEFIKSCKDASAMKRAIAVSMIESGIDVAITGLTQGHARRLRRAYVLQGAEVLGDKRKCNRERILTAREKKRVIENLEDKLPCDLGLGSENKFWTTVLLGDYIFQLTGKRYKSRTIDKTFKLAPN